MSATNSYRTEVEALQKQALACPSPMISIGRDALLGLCELALSRAEPESGEAWVRAVWNDAIEAAAHEAGCANANETNGHDCRDYECPFCGITREIRKLLKRSDATHDQERK